MGKEIKNDVVKEIHQIFLESMEIRYKEVLTFLGFLLPSLTAFIILSYNFNLNQNLFIALKNKSCTNDSIRIDSLQHKQGIYISTKNIEIVKDSSILNLNITINQPQISKIEDKDKNEKNENTDNKSIIFTFFLGSTIILFILTWGAIYFLAISYRYRYLQASVYLIEETTGANKYIPSSFKPKRILKLKNRLLLDLSPNLLQVNIHFLSFSIIGIAIVFNYLTIINDLIIYSTILSIIAIIFIFMIYYTGGWRYPKKMDKIIADLELKLDQINKEDCIRTNQIILNQ